ncbi:glycerophosphodiester phosphodiesterase family protein [Microbacterium sp. CIAB417]|uniref:glycerophosphodiester phosphodiesterase family protein n=1 Tax=Microbacterium sp. CIAB417 TaxID=2860287 RepID=UPI001FABE815|nr:glycerophosphodiester phosphodiesterase family protein [Microbacterium sp. CIAB417]
MTHPYFIGTPHPRVLAHRGLPSADEDSAVWENTAAAFAAARAAGAAYIETDCRVTSDGDAVLFHDETLERLFGDPRPVAEVRTRELAELLAPHGGLMTVAEALTGFPESRFNIDVKTDAAAKPLGAVIAAHAHRVLLTSFSDARRRRAVEAAIAAGAELRPAVSAGRGTIIALRLLAAVRFLPRRLLDGVDAVQIPERQGPIRVFVPSLVRAAHRAGVEVHVWTVNDAADMRRLVDAGADGIVTDRADVAVRALSSA